MPRKCKTHLKTLKPVTMSLAIRLVLFYLLVVEGVESNPGSPGPSRRSNTGEHAAIVLQEVAAVEAVEVEA